MYLHYLGLLNLLFNSIIRKAFRLGSEIFSRTIFLALSTSPSKSFVISSAYSIQTQFAHPDIQQVVGSGGSYRINI